MCSVSSSCGSACRGCDIWEEKPHDDVCVDCIGPIIPCPGEPVQRSPWQRCGAPAAAFIGLGYPGVQGKGAKVLLSQLLDTYPAMPYTQPNSSEPGV